LKETEGASSQRQNILWFKNNGFSRPFDDKNKICESIVMKSPEAEVTFPTTPIKSRDPKKYDGKVIKLSVRGVTYGCPLFVLNAKKWTPPLTTSPTTQNSSKTTQITAESSNGETMLWIGIGVGIFVLLIIFVVLGYCCYRIQTQKKSLSGKKNDVQQKDIMPKSQKAEVVKEKTADEKEVEPEPSKEATKEDSTVAKERQPTPAKKKAPKEKKAPVVVPKPSKGITQENGTKEDSPLKKVSTEPALQDSSTEASVVQQKQLRNSPKVFVPKKVILPAMNSDRFKIVSLLDTLSGAENDETQNSTHAFEKSRKNESARRKKGSKKHR
jgi:hypothetical protein